MMNLFLKPFNLNFFKSKPSQPVVPVEKKKIHLHQLKKGVSIRYKNKHYKVVGRASIQSLKYGRVTHPDNAVIPVINEYGQSTQLCVSLSNKNKLPSFELA